MKLSKENFGWIVTCVSLALLLGISLYLGLSGYFFKTQISYVTEFEIGKAQDIAIKKNEASVLPLNLEGSYLGGERLPQIISIKNEGEEKLYLRAKVLIYTKGNETKPLDIVQSINWNYNNEDGYYYFDDLVKPEEKVALCSHVIMSEDDSISTNKKYIISFIFESLDENEDVENFWGFYPIEND